MEDLWGFNDERVAQAVFDCQVPVISAVGHETDFTIADFVADLRAPTPSAAAELAVCDVASTLRRIKDYRARLSTGMGRAINEARMINAHYSGKLALLSPENRIKESRNRLSRISDSFENIMKNRLVSKKHRLELDAGKLHGLSPLTKLSSGYAYVSKEGQNVKSIENIKSGDTLKINVTDGVITSTVTDTLGSDLR